MKTPLKFGLADMAAFNAKLRGIGRGCACLEDAAREVADVFYRGLFAASGEPACALARVYKVHPYGLLPADLQAFARGLCPADSLHSETQCLALLSTRGDEADWNDRRQSKGHKAIPLHSEGFVGGIPMLARLLEQFGVELRSILNYDPKLFPGLESRSFSVFHVPEALGSPYIPAQEGFVAPHGVQSCIGFGAMLPGGRLFAVILFLKASLTKEVADLFAPLAMSVKLAFLPFADGEVFHEAP